MFSENCLQTRFLWVYLSNTQTLRSWRTVFQPSFMEFICQAHRHRVDRGVTFKPVSWDRSLQETLYLHRTIHQPNFMEISNTETSFTQRNVVQNNLMGFFHQNDRHSVRETGLRTLLYGFLVSSTQLLCSRVTVSKLYLIKFPCQILRRHVQKKKKFLQTYLKGFPY